MINYNQRYKKIMLSVMLLIVFGIVAFKIINNIEFIAIGIANAFSFIWNMLLPIIIGAFIAFILNSGVNFLENDISNLFCKGKKTKLIRMISVFLVYLVAVGLITLTIVYLIPTIEDSIDEFRTNLPTNLEKAQEVLKSSGININVDLEKEISKKITEFLKNENAMTVLITNIASVTSTVLNFILGFIISFYILVDKDKLGKMCKKLVCVIVKKEKVGEFIDFCHYVSKTFDKFIVGKVIDSVIIGLISYIGFMVMDVKYKLIFSIIIGVTNVIPYFGPFMGAIPVGILVFLYNPKMTLPVLLFIFVLQQFDGSILGPKVLGDAIGVSPIAVIISILIGGALGGVIGMFLAVPTYVVLSEIVIKFIDNKYNEKFIKKEGKKFE